MSESVPEIVREVLGERWKQDKWWGRQRHHAYRWLAILMEEVGEASTAILKGESSYRDELIQVAAVAIAAIECLDEHGVCGFEVDEEIKAAMGADDE